MRLKEKVAIVTGASSGIGKAIALGFAKEGAIVNVCYYGHEENAAKVLEEIRTIGSDGMICRVDIASKEDCEKMVAATVEKYGRLDILVNNAGARDQAPIMEVTSELWKHAIDSNLGGVFWSTRAAAAQMIKQEEGGAIINIASLQGVRPCNDQRTAYCTTKRGIIVMTRAAAAELGKYRIRVNAISPGTIATNMGGMASMFTDEVIQERCKYIPLRYRGAAEELVGPAVFLASGESSYVTGQNLIVDGGWSAVD